MGGLVRRLGTMVVRDGSALYKQSAASNNAFPVCRVLCACSWMRRFGQGFLGGPLGLGGWPLPIHLPHPHPQPPFISKTTIYPYFSYFPFSSFLVTRWQPFFYSWFSILFVGVRGGGGLRRILRWIHHLSRSRSPSQIPVLIRRWRLLGIASLLAVRCSLNPRYLLLPILRFEWGLS